MIPVTLYNAYWSFILCLPIFSCQKVSKPKRPEVLSYAKKKKKNSLIYHDSPLLNKLKDLFSLIQLTIPT